MRSEFVGKEGFLWFIGKVEDVNDPLKLGRVRVRINNVHTEDPSILATDRLPWATPMQGITSAAILEKGQSPTGLLVGSSVIGFFADAKRYQQPIIMGTFAGNTTYPDSDDGHEVNQLARGTNKLTKTPDSTNSEPDNPYAAEYPKNHVYESESGHIVEIDDTADAERIHIYHKSGTFIEMHPNGDVVTHHKNGFRTVTGNDKLHVTGNLNIVADGDITMDGSTINLNSGTKGAARVGDTADTGDDPPGISGTDGSNKIETGSSTVFIGG